MTPQKSIEDVDLFCTDCCNTGEVPTDENDGEGHTERGVGTRKCHCKTNDDNHE